VAFSLLLLLAACSGGHDTTGPPKLAFSVVSGDTASIYVVNADGTALKRLTKGAYDTQPAWSADGSQIAFVRSSGPGGKDRSIYVMNADGSAPKRIGSGWDPAWAPAGGVIAFTDTSGGGTSIYIMRDDGSDRRKVGPTGRVDRPVWAPDSKRIMFVLCHRGGLNHCSLGLYVLKTFTTLALAEAAPDVQPVWSPQLARVLYWVDLKGGGDIFSMDMKAPPLSLPLTLSKTYNEKDPVWSPTSSEIAFVRDDNIWKMTSGGSQQTQVTHGGGSATPVWATSGSIAFLRSPKHGETDVVLVRSDGTGLKTVFKGNARDLTAIG
jgi:Tol biopolymer transport system component